MIKAQYIHTIKVLRFLSSSQNDLGEFSFSSSSFVSNGQTEIPCRIETHREETEHRDSGKRMKNVTIIYIDPAYVLRRGDVVLAGTKRTPELSLNEVLGEIIDVTPAILGFSSKIDHYEIRLENP
jgi:hypothetical protein